MKSDQLWKNNTVVPCSTTYDLRNLLKSTKLDDFDLAFIHTGVNDIDTDDGKSVANNLIDITRKIRQYYPHIKVVVSEVTPRQLYRDKEVQACNSALHSSLEDEDNVTIAEHFNLRNDRWSFHIKNDDKHFAQISIGRFAKNLKIAFRKALGLPLFEKRKNATRNNAFQNNTSRRRNPRKESPNNLNNMGDDVQVFKQKLISFLSSC